MSRLILVTGGARSGKSDYGVNRAESMAGPHVFLATCPAVDEEMEERIRRHKIDRQNGDWHTIEEELDLAGTIRTLHPGTVCLVDCLTLWVNNLMYHYESSKKEISEDAVAREAENLVETAAAFSGTLIFVTNEVGLGVVPDNPTARLYRDLVGRCNRIIAAAADEVIFISCGLPLFLKGQPNRD